MTKAALIPLLLLTSIAFTGASELTVYFGTYTRGESKGIYAASFDESTGALGEHRLVAEIPNPSFLTLHPNGQSLYAVSETGRFQDQPTGGITAFRIEEDSSLTTLNAMGSGGKGPCHVSLNAAGTAAFTANYSGGSCASYPVKPDGSLGEAASVHQHEGSSVHPRKQTRPHAHAILPDPSGRFVLVPDLGMDKVLVYQLDPATAALTPQPAAHWSSPPGSGPRHLAFHPGGKLAFSNLEMTSQLAALRFDPESGALKTIEIESTLPGDFSGRNSTAETLVHPSGRFVYTSNRGHNSIAAFAIDLNSGELELIEHESTRGAVPRNFGITPSGAYLIAANQGSNDVAVFRIDADSGALEPVGDPVRVPSPVCVRFHPPAAP